MSSSIKTPMLIDFVHQEISGLKEKQAHLQQQIQTVQKELQRLTDTNLVISGALQALSHVVEQDQKTRPAPISRLPSIPEEVNASDAQAPDFDGEFGDLDQAFDGDDGQRA